MARNIFTGRRRSLPESCAATAAELALLTVCIAALSRLTGFSLTLAQLLGGALALFGFKRYLNGNAR